MSLIKIDNMMKWIVTYIFLGLSMALSVPHQAKACTVMSCSLRGEVFAAANEDDYIGFARMWFNPQTPERYGSVCFGLPDLQAQAGMNEFGLFFDFTAQNIDPAKYEIKHPYKGDLFFDILGKCKTVDEALAFLKEQSYSNSAQVLIADATGNSVVINLGTTVVKKGSYQVNTNFDIKNLKDHNYSCRRYDLSDAALADAKSLSVDFFKDILDRTHQEGKLATIYSNIYDLKRGLIYVYHFHNFQQVYVIDLKKELQKGYRLERISDYFPTSFAYELFTQQDKAMFRKEVVLDEIRLKGLDLTLDRHLEMAMKPGTDSTLNLVLLEVGLQLVKDACNRASGGAMWSYWFNQPDGFNIVPFQDRRLEAADRIFAFLLDQDKLDQQYRNFIYEINGYTKLVRGDRSTAGNYYEKAAASPADSWPISYQRSKEMLKHLKP
ncbi:hypothetical protein PBAL39_00285 [Pedobacter sp. BAL39]|nr:hypothetical protein PBAL39_00285 [Pedobacter sp. BAL39]